MPCLASFSPFNPLIFCLIPTLYAHSLFKNESFFECSWVIILKGLGKEKKFRVNRFLNMAMKGKSYFLHGLALSSKHYLHFLLGFVERKCKEKNNLTHEFKKWRARRAKCEVLISHSNVQFPRKVPIFTEEAKRFWTSFTQLFFRGLISYCWYNPQPMRKDHSIAGITILQTTPEDADNTQFYWW